MNFTHLMPDHKQPSQMLLQRYSCFLVIVVLSDSMRQFVLDTVRFDLESTDNVLCQIVLPEHLELASPGTMLASMANLLHENSLTPNLHHSFIASTTRNELVSHPPAGGDYYPLMLNTIPTNEEKIAHLKRALSDAIQRTTIAQKTEKIAHTFRMLGPAATFVATVYRLSHGLP